MASSQIRALRPLMRSLRAPQRAFTTSAPRFEASAGVPASSKHEPADAAAAVPEDQAKEPSQAPNRLSVWSRSQKPRSQAMTGPRFEQTDFSLQPQPLSAMEMVHKVPVKWVHERTVVCDGGGGAGGHPKIFINTDKAEIAFCNYCGNPFANEHHRKHLESLPATSYPLE
ncbi:Lactobacillus shifted protein [Escovopsis weberi]|uniref:Lactobacillus shifted protein n=1 Tax=Escovopsis weberi TaxID=150374 RepID=A0A0M8N3I7_ESCWE|nr:Lactobacillus shifted protein [Escovopsis weberi]